MKHVAMIVLLAALCGCTQTSQTREPAPASAHRRAAAPAPTYAGGDGSSAEKAVVIVGAQDENAGVEAENAWLRKNYPGFRMRGQAVLHAGGKYYQRQNIITAEGDAKSVFFDITDFFAKF